MTLRTHAYQGVTYIQDGNILTTAGVSSSIEGALQLVEQTRGKAVADSVARAIQHRRGTPAYPNPHRAPVMLQ